MSNLHEWALVSLSTASHHGDGTMEEQSQEGDIAWQDIKPESGTDKSCSLGSSLIGNKSVQNPFVNPSKGSAYNVLIFLLQSLKHSTTSPHCHTKDQAPYT
jgi:hypothetical protein